MNSRFQSRVVPARRVMSAAWASVGVESRSHACHLRSCRRLTWLFDSTPTLAQAADMTLRVGTTRDWKREFISHLLLAFAFAFEGVCVVAFSSYSGGAPAVDKISLI